MTDWLSKQNPEAHARSMADQNASFEETIIKKLMAEAGCTYHLSSLRKEAASMNGGIHLLTFDWFSSAFPGFPVRLGAARLTGTHKITCGQLFGSSFTKLSFFKEYQHFLDQSGLDEESERVGLVFNWSGVKTGGRAMVLHNYPVSSSNIVDPDLRIERGTRIVRPFGNPVVVYVIESLHDLMLSVGNDWTG